MRTLLGTTVVLLALGLVPSCARPAAAERDARKEAAATGTPPRNEPRRPRSPDGRTRDPDQELIEHLDEIERMELLQNLELFDTAAPARKR